MFFFAMESVINAIISKYHHQMVFYINLTSNILMDMMRIPLGTLEIKFYESKMFIYRNWLHSLMSHKLKKTKKDIYSLLIFITRMSLQNEESTYLYHISLYTDIIMTVFDNGSENTSKLAR